MIARNERTQIRKRLVQQRKQTEAFAIQNARKTIAVVLWKLITMEAESADEEIQDGTASLTVPVEDLECVPANFGLNLRLNQDEGTLTIGAVLLKPKSPIILPGDG